MKYSAYRKALFCTDRNCRGCQERRFHLNRPLVKFIVRKHFPRAENAASYGGSRDYDDFIQAGETGLWYACQRIDPARNNAEIRGYLFTCIHGFLMSSLREAGKDHFLNEHGHWPKLMPVDFSLTKKESAFDGPFAYDIPDSRLAQEALHRLEETQLTMGNKPWWNIDEFGSSEKAMLHAAVQQLPERLQVILETRLDGDSLETAGRKLGLTRERARQLQTRALHALFRLFNGRVANDTEINELSQALASWEA